MYESSDTLLVQFLTTAIVFVYAAVRDLDNCGCGFQRFDNYGYSCQKYINYL